MKALSLTLEEENRLRRRRFEAARARHRNTGGGLTFAVGFNWGTLVPHEGQVAPAFTRTTTSTVDDFEQVVRTALSGEARFRGLRRVRNHLTLSSENLSGWTLGGNGTGVAPIVTANFATGPSAGMMASRVVFDRGAGTTSADWSRVRQSLSGTIISAISLGSLWMKLNSGTTRVLTLRNGSGGSNVEVTVTTSWQRFSSMVGSGAATFEIFYFGDDNPTNQTADVLISGCMAEDPTGQSNTNPAEYVSVGVLSSPFHGCMVDGVKYFPWENGNTVASNVVTEAQGAMIAAATRRGLSTDPQRINICLQSQDLATTWAPLRATVSANAITAPDGTSTADKLVEDATAANSHFISQTGFSFTAAVHTYSKWLKAGERTWAALRTLDGTTTCTCFFDLENGVVGTQTSCSGLMVEYPDGWYRCSLTMTAAAAAAAGTLRIFLADGDNSLNYDGDGASGIYVWGSQCEAGQHAGPYIPTTTVSVTRNGDVPAYPATSWFNQAEGCFVWKGNYNTANNVAAKNAWSCAVDSQEFHQLQQDNGDTDFEYQVNHLGAVEAAIGIGVVDLSQHTHAASYKVNNAICALDGVASSADTAFTPPTGATWTLRIGCSPGGSANGACDTASLTYYCRQPANADLVRLAA